MNKINKCFEEFSEYQDSLSTNKGVIGVDRSEILDIKAGWCNNLHKQEHIDPIKRKSMEFLLRVRWYKRLPSNVYCGVLLDLNSKRYGLVVD